MAKIKLKKAVSILMSAVLAVSLVTIFDNTAEQASAASSSGLADGKQVNIGARISVHDPSIVDGKDGYYYIFGSHKAWARSTDLTNWSSVDIHTDCASVFQTPGSWAKRANNSYDINGNLWAPDVIYNSSMGKWCMYMSVNGDDFTSSIALATADSITGPYKYEGIIVYSGFRSSGNRSYIYTDYQKATGSTNVSRYLTSDGGWNSAYGTNAIDPCVKYDENGDLWMSYGSWFGGIYMLKLDKNTGLRDYTYTYKTVTNESDAYLGKKLAGGYGQSGEGSYIVYDKESGYYYLYLSYNGLNATDNFSGYHLRMYRSKNITGPYTDAAGRSAIYSSQYDDQSICGVKLFGNYAFSSMAGNGQNSSNGYMSGGHNSAFVDDEGNHYLIYHTRFNVGQEWHEVRTHQQFMNEDGWLVTAPYEYQGSKISETGYSADEIAGCYEFINHGLTAQTTYTDMIPSYQVILSKDGTIGGDAAGTWVEKKGSYLAEMNIDGITYKGVFFKQYDESKTRREVMTFSLIGDNNTSVWGSKIADSADLIWDMVGKSFEGKISGNVKIPQYQGVVLSSDSKYLKIAEDGTKAIYQAPEKDTVATLTAEITVAGKAKKYTKKVTLAGYENVGNDDRMAAYYEFESEINKDSSSYGNTLTAYGTKIVTDSERGNVASFNGSGDYLQLPASVTSSDNFTFMAWVKVDANTPWCRVFDFGDGEGNSIFLTTHAYTPECLRAAYAVNAEEIQANTCGTYANMYIHKWVNMAVTVNSATKTMSFYLDGKLVDTAEITGNLTDVCHGTKNYIGKSQYPDATFAGYMDDIMIFHEALSTKEIQHYLKNGVKKDVQNVDDNSGIVVVEPGTYVKVLADGKTLECTADNSAVSKVCSDGMLLALSEGTTMVNCKDGEGNLTSMRIVVEEEQDVMYGDVDGSGDISVVDMEAIQKHLLLIQSLDDKALKAGSITSFDGSVSVLDMEMIQKHILGLSFIRQYTR